VFVEEGNNLFDSFSGGMHVDSGEALHYPHSDSSPHVDHWTKTSMGMQVNSRIFLSDGEPTFLHLLMSQNGRLLTLPLLRMCGGQSKRIKIHMRTHLGLLVHSVIVTKIQL
jgi:hypothetical protein